MSWYDRVVEYVTKKGVKKKWVLKAAVFSGLRRMSYRTPMYAEAKRKARVSRGKYRCTSCKKLFGPKEIQIDHIEPVISPETGFKTFDEYIDRLFCSKEGLQVLCKKKCHKEKTKAEVKVRAKKNRNSKRRK